MFTRDPKQLCGLLFQKLSCLYPETHEGALEKHRDVSILLAGLDPWQRQDPIHGEGPCAHFCPESTLEETRGQCPVFLQVVYGRLVREASHLRDQIPLLGGDCMLGHPRLGGPVREAVQQLVRAGLQSPGTWIETRDECAKYLRGLLHSEPELPDTYRCIRLYVVYHRKYHEKTEALDTALLDNWQEQLWKSVAKAQRTHDVKQGEKAQEAQRQCDHRRQEAMRKKDPSHALKVASAIGKNGRILAPLFPPNRQPVYKAWKEKSILQKLTQKIQGERAVAASVCQ